MITSRWPVAILIGHNR